jgi:uncharacterized phage-associated protein
MRLRFNERKATQAAGLLLQLRGGKMSYMKLIKLLYLADREALLQWGRPITTDRYFSMNRGPVLSRILDLATDGEDPGSPSIWANHISEPAGYEVRLQTDAGCDELSDAEVGLLKKVFQTHGNKTRWEMVDQGGAIPITYRDILKAGGKTELEIAAIEDELEGVALAENLLGAH